MLYNADFLEIYEELCTLTEALAGSKLTKAIDENCKPISKVIPSMSDIVDGYEIFVGNRFTRDFKTFSREHRDISKKVIEKLTNALSSLTGGIPDARTADVAIKSPIKFKELKIGRFRDKQEARAIYFILMDKETNRKFFILGSFFIHKDEKLTADEKESAVGTFKNIQNFR